MTTTSTSDSVIPFEDIFCSLLTDYEKCEKHFQSIDYKIKLFTHIFFNISIDI